jgi:hypothetical protein
VLPKAALGVNAPSSATRYKSFYVYGTIKPAHSGARVRIEAYKKYTSGYKRVKYIYVTTSTTSLKGKLSLSAGRYRVRLVHSDTGHAASYSAWDYLNVK